MTGQAPRPTHAAVPVEPGAVPDAEPPPASANARTLRTEGARWIDTFLEAQAAERGAARNTIAAYRRDLADFVAWLTRRGMAPSQAARADVETYLVDCDVQGLAQATRARRLSAVKQLFRFAYEEG